MADNHPHHRPKFHISPPRGYLNDPNGPIEVGGLLHLYFQSRSLAEMTVPVEWGHATTPDLVHWTLHRPAMSPLPGGLDSEGCWSGNTVADGDRVRAYYSGHVAGRPLEHILTTVSDAEGNAFGSPRLLLDDPGADEGVRMFRDPFVWTDTDGRHMAVGTAVEGGLAAIRHYRSDDGLSWRYAGHLAELERTHLSGVDSGEGWECPQIIRVDSTEVAVVCAWSFQAGPASVVAFPVGEPHRLHPVDDGHDFYAPSVLREGSYGPLLFGWIREGRDEAWWQEEGWSGAISLPRRAWLATDRGGAMRLGTEPHPAVSTLRASSALPADGAALPAQAEIVVPVACGRVRLRFGEEEWVDIELDGDADTVSIDTDHASVDPRARGGRAVAAAAFDEGSSRPVARIFLDGSVLEVFTSSGRALTTRVYPRSGAGWSVEAPRDALIWELSAAVSTETAASEMDARALAG
ncbi:MAG: glycoside hydrolase family 32 protein [Microbacteriaceae bacterium]|nr:glycoside hydrolase family 32 protein [Microbacteriaceae bacterium]MCL2796170.1 glycoside hydrolase family 32 protein [Microbacteriaceae bacterium]